MNEHGHSHFLSIGREVLPILEKPLPDELLSSWIMRFSRKLLTKSHTFCKFIYERENVWNRDIDFNASDAFIDRLASKSFLRFDDVYNTTLRSYSSTLFVNSLRRWVIPIHIYHRTRTATGQMFCPCCLRKDPIPYFRKKWRLSFSVVCPLCGVLLLDCCPRCHSPIAFHRLEVGIKEEILTKEISTCFNCSYDLRRSKEREADSSIIELQKYFYSTLDKGYTETLQYSHLYFDVIYQLTKMLDSSTKKLRSFDKEVCRRTRMRFVSEASGIDFDKKGVAQRIVILKKIEWLLSEWPKRLLETSTRTKTFSSFLLKDMKAPPYWFWKVVKENSYIVFSEWRQRTNLPNFNSYSSYGQSRLENSSTLP